MKQIVLCYTRKLGHRLTEVNLIKVTCLVNSKPVARLIYPSFGSLYIIAKLYNRFFHLNVVIELEVIKHLLHLLVYCKNKSKWNNYSLNTLLSVHWSLNISLIYWTHMTWKCIYVLLSKKCPTYICIYHIIPTAFKRRATWKENMYFKILD